MRKDQVGSSGMSFIPGISGFISTLAGRLVMRLVESIMRTLMAFPEGIDEVKDEEVMLDMDMI